MQRSTIEHDTILGSIQALSLAIRRILDLDVGGRSMMAFMRGHMAEMQHLLNTRDYFAKFYQSVGKEFIQYDDYSFVLHHCSRFLYQHWKEEMDVLDAGPLGQSLSSISARLPELRAKPTAPDRRPGAVQGSWYNDVYESLSNGLLPQPRGQLNEVLPRDACVLQGPLGEDLIWGSFLVYACDVWARQLPLMWTLVRETIQLRRLIHEQLTPAQVTGLVTTYCEEFSAATLEYAQLVAEWQAYHAKTVSIHDPMFDRNVGGLFEWAGSLTPDLDAWTIKNALKDEMYVELASTVLALRGKAVEVAVPAKRYWRVLHFAPSSNAAGAPGMPPFLPN